MKFASNKKQCTMTVSIKTESMPDHSSISPKTDAHENGQNPKIEALFNKHFRASDKNKGVTMVSASNLEIADCDPKDLHNFILDLERLGKDVRIEKKTVVEIVDRA